MTWINDINKTLTLKTGDNKTYTPIWNGAKITQGFNVSSFNFPNLAGTLIHRRQTTGKKYEVNIYFQGDDHINDSDAFLKSAENSKPWTLQHPYFGSKDILCHPISEIDIDRVNHNITNIKVTVQETNQKGSSTVNIQKSGSSLVDGIKTTFTEVITLSQSSYLDVRGRDSQVFGNELEAYNIKYSKQITNSDEANRFTKLYKKAKSDLARINANTSLALQSIQALAQFPYSLSSSVFNRANYLVDQFSRTRIYMLALSDFSSNAKRQLEFLNGNLLSALFISSVTKYNYQTKSDVTAMIKLCIDTWNTYINDLDTIQDIHYNDTDSYAPNPNFLTELENLFAQTIGGLEIIALESKQEFVINLQEDSDPINLTQRFYGDVGENLEYFIDTNNLSLLEHLEIKKGRRVRYFI